MKPGTRNLLVTAVVVLALVGIYLARAVLVPFLMGAVIAYVLNPMVAALERRGIRRSMGTIVVMLGLALVLAGLLAFMVPEIIAQIRQFGDRLPGYIAAVQEKLRPLEEYLRERYPDQLEALRTQSLQTARGLLPSLAGWAAASVKGVMTSTFKLIVWLLTIVIIPAFAYYLLVDYEDIRDTLKALVPKHLRPAVGQRFVEIDRVLRTWLKSQLIVALLLALIYVVGLMLLGVPLGLLIGLVGGLANLVPYLGLVVGFFPAAILSFLDTGSWVGPTMVAGVFLFGQLIESTIITPKVIGGGLGIPSAAVLLAVLVGGELFGFMGLLLAVPVTAAALVLLKDLRRSYDDSQISDRRARWVSAGTRWIRRRRPRV